MAGPDLLHLDCGVVGRRRRVHPPGPPGAPLQVVRELREQQAHRDVDGRDHHRHRQDRRAQLALAAQEAGLVEQLGVEDQEAERGVLEHHDELADDRRQHRAQRLRQQDVRHHLGLAHAQRVGRLALPARQRRHAGAEHLGEHRAVVERQPEHERGERRDVDAEPAGQAEVEDEDQDEQRDGAEELDDDGRGPAEPAVVRQPAGGEHRAEQQRQHRRQREGAQRVEQGVERAAAGCSCRGSTATRRGRTGR